MPIDMKLVIAGQFKELVRRGNVDKITVKALIEVPHLPPDLLLPFSGHQRCDGVVLSAAQRPSSCCAEAAGAAHFAAVWSC